MDRLLFDIGTECKEDIRSILKELSTTCTACRLSLLHPYNRGFLARGDPLAKIGVLAEAPGDKETEQGQPLVGASGKEWDNWARAIGLDTNKDCFHTNVIQCFTGDTIVESNGIYSIYRRFYDGPGLKITTAEGNVLTGTPNHPILTARGWVPLNKIHKGDYLIHTDFIGDVRTIRPNKYSRPATLSQLFDSLSVKYPITRIISTRNNFHGDGSNRHIDIISANRELWLDANSSISKSSNKFSFVLANHGSISKLCLSSVLRYFKSMLLAFWLATNSSIGFLRKLFPIGLISRLISKFIPFRNTSEINASLNKFIHNSLITNASLFRELSKASPRQISVRQVIDIQVVKLTEHIYNLSTVDSIYFANNILVHNCQPHKVMREGKMSQEPPDKDEIRACWIPRGLRVLKAMPNLEVVITLGWVAAKAILGGEPKARTHEGNWFESTALPGIGIFCLAHPAFILREPSPEKDYRIADYMKAFKREYLDGKKCYHIAQAVKEKRDACTS